MLIHVIQYFNIVNRLELYYFLQETKKDIFEILINYKESYNLFKCSYHGTETSCGLYHFFIKFLPYSFQFFWTAKPLIHFQKYIVYVFICVSQNKQEYVKLPLSIFFAILYKISILYSYYFLYFIFTTCNYKNCKSSSWKPRKSFQQYKSL